MGVFLFVFFKYDATILHEVPPWSICNTDHVTTTNLTVFLCILCYIATVVHSCEVDPPFTANYSFKSSPTFHINIRGFLAILPIKDTSSSVRLEIEHLLISTFKFSNWFSTRLNSGLWLGQALIFIVWLYVSLFVFSCYPAEGFWSWCFCHHALLWRGCTQSEVLISPYTSSVAQKDEFSFTDKNGQLWNVFIVYLIHNKHHFQDSTRMLCHVCFSSVRLSRFFCLHVSGNLFVEHSRKKWLPFHPIFPIIRRRSCCRLHLSPQQPRRRSVLCWTATAAST